MKSGRQALIVVDERRIDEIQEIVALAERSIYGDTYYFWTEKLSFSELGNVMVIVD